MWVLVWMQLTTVVTHFEIGQYASENGCFTQLTKATVLVTKNNEYLHCFKIGVLTDEKTR